MGKKLSTLFLLSALVACSSSPDEKPYEVVSQQFYEKTNEQGQKLFAYVMAVKANKRTNLNMDKPVSRSQLKSYLEQEHFDESPALKLQLEDEAAAALKKELKARNYCPQEYDINEVLWRDFSVQLRGQCN
ncbi:hypothetical protein AAEU32_07840 [Pseudoalteromonas sp. SSDWG2]|uniref:hypothetical protein n=1 Tax=Pseudoalteromonas sp. SSDWG2 TaxID=3139391 RepID=UPI003BAD86AE